MLSLSTRNDWDQRLERTRQFLQRFPGSCLRALETRRKQFHSPRVAAFVREHSFSGISGEFENLHWFPNLLYFLGPNICHQFLLYSGGQHAIHVWNCSSAIGQGGLQARCSDNLSYKSSNVYPLSARIARNKSVVSRPRCVSTSKFRDM
jgi:hypothetical protein